MRELRLGLVTMSANATEDADQLVAALSARLAGSMPFREDTALIPDLLREVRPVLEALARGYVAGAGASAAQHEGFALLRLLARRAALLGATPSAALALAWALDAALRDCAVGLAAGARDELTSVAVEGYSAGRDEQREQELRRIAAESQVWFALVPRCYVVCLAGSHHPEQLEQTLDTLARELFRGDARAVLLDLGRLAADDQDSARLLVSFAGTQLGLGASVLLCGANAGLSRWFGELELTRRGVEPCDGFAAGVARALALCGHDLRTRGRLGGLMQRVRSGSR